MRTAWATTHGHSPRTNNSTADQAHLWRVPSAAAPFTLKARRKSAGTMDCTMVSAWTLSSTSSRDKKSQLLPITVLIHITGLVLPIPLISEKKRSVSFKARIAFKSEGLTYWEAKETSMLQSPSSPSKPLLWKFPPNNQKRTRKERKKPQKK